MKSNAKERLLLQERRRGHFKRKMFWAGGLWDVIAVDQHDKWKYKFGLALHVAVEPMSGLGLWLKAWWNNSNPKVIAAYYLDWIEENRCELHFTIRH